MKKLCLTVLILTLLAASANATENQSIIFSGNYLYNNLNTGEVTEADSAWLHIFYYDTKIGSTKVTAEDLQWDGYYQYVHHCTNDSVQGWAGRWVYFDYAMNVLQTTEMATITTARDSSYSTLTASDNIGLNLADYTGQWEANAFDLTYYIGVAYYVWANATKTITGSDNPLPIDLDDVSGTLDKATETTGFDDPSCTGGGSDPLHVYALNTVGSTAINKILITVNTKYDASGSKYYALTDGTGLAVFGMSDGDELLMLTSAAGWSFTQDSILKGAGTDTDTLWGTQWSPGAPVSAEACSVYGWLYDVESDSVAGATIIFELMSDQDTLYYDNVTYLKGRTIVESNQDGYWSTNVIPNALLDTTSFYSVDIIRDHKRAPILSHFDVYVPDSATVNFIDLVKNFNRKGK